MRALPDVRLALEPPAVRLLDVLAAGREHVEDEVPSRRQTAPHRPDHRAPVGVGLHVQQRAERRGHEREHAVDRRIAHVAVAQVDVHARELCALARDLEHPRGEVDADDVDPGGRDRHGDAAGADTELEHRPAEPPCLLDVEGDVLDHRHGPGVVEAGDLVVGGHWVCFVPMQTTSLTLFSRPRCATGGVV